MSLTLCKFKTREMRGKQSTCDPMCVSGYPLAICQVDLPKSGVKLRRWLTLMVLVQENRRTTNFQTQLLCSLK